MTLSELRTSKGLSKKEMAQAMGISIPTYNAREMNPKRTKMHEIFYLCKELKLSEDEQQKFLESFKN